MPTNFHTAPRPWAAIKHGLLQYVELFLGKLGRPGKKVYHVDGFAGSGRLEDGSEGSPLKVARIAQNPRQTSRRDMLKCINCEKEPEVFARLEAATEEFVHAGIVQNLQGEFDTQLPEILEIIGDSPALFFIDPFGTQGAELSTLEAIARSARGREVLVRFDDTRVKRLIRLASNNISSLDSTQRRIAEALTERVAEFATAEDVAQTLALLDAKERVASREVLIEAYRRIVIAKTDFTHDLSYPLRNPKTGGHRYFIVHFCSHPDGYVHMADFMAKAERAFQRRQSELVFGNPDQMEFPNIQEHIDDAVHADKQSLVLAKLPAIIDGKRWKGKPVEGRRVFEAIVAEFGWQVLRKEYLAALRELKKQGRVKFGELDDNAVIEFLK
jgi:three-Cys-motif partner protein